MLWKDKLNHLLRKLTVAERQSIDPANDPKVKRAKEFYEEELEIWRSRYEVKRLSDEDSGTDWDEVY